MPYGYLDTSFIDFPGNVDVAYIEGLRTRAGVDFPALLREIDQRLGAFNAAVDPIVASLITPTTEPYAEAGGPAAFQVTRRGEYTIARPQVAEIGAHMLPLHGYDVTLGLTEDALEQMRMSAIVNNIESMLLGYRTLHRKEALRRLTSDAEVRVADRTTVTSPGFAGSGTGDNVFQSTAYPDGTALPGSYTHYYAVGAGTLAATLLSARNRLRRWHAGPYDLLASADEIALIVAIAPGDPANGFVSAGSALVRPGVADAAAAVDPAVYLGVLYGDIRVHMAVEDWSDPVIAIYKSYGPLDPRNALAWRYDEARGRNAVLRYRSLYPLDNAILRQDFGVGVNNRTAAVLIDTGAAPYTAPTIA